MRLLLSLACAGLVLGTVPAQTLPSGFSDELVFSGLALPTGFDFFPDGRFLVCEHLTGELIVVANGVQATMGTITDLVAGGERGLLACAVDAQWPTRPYVYALYTSMSPQNVRISMFPVTGALSDASSTNLVLGAEFRLIDDIPDADVNHNGGKLRFGPDGFLYVALGDDTVTCSAQDTDSLLGKILRLDVSAMPVAGSGPPSKSLLAPANNPFTGTDGQLVWAKGLRHPFSFDIDPSTGDLFIADVGSAQEDEVDRCDAPGLNFGWPYLEGAQSFNGCPGAPPPFVAPLASVVHGVGSVAIISFTLYRDQSAGAFGFGPEYEGDYFFVDYFSGDVFRLDFDGVSWGSPVVWASGIDFVTDARVGPDGAVYYVKRLPGPGSLRRVRGPGGPAALSIVAGAGQPGNAGQPLQDALKVAATDALGAPLANVPVTFALVAGSGTLGPQPVLTASDGTASTTFVLDGSDPTDPQIAATVAGSLPPAVFDVVWRGLEATVSGNDLTLVVHHSQTGSPFSLAIQVPVPAGPVFSTPFGDLWTDVLAPGAGFAILDGLGLVGPPAPLWVTDASVPDATLVFPGALPLGAVVLLQAYAIDTTWVIGPTLDPRAFMISNPVTL